MFLLMVYLTSDHAGFELKKYLASELKARGYEIKDLGPDTYNPNDDYPDYIKKLGEEFPADGMGIVICKNGVGVSVMVNRYKGIRCALSWEPKHSASARNDDNANVLALPADYISQETALEVALAFLTTPFSQEERHQRRITKIDDYTGHP